MKLIHCADLHLDSRMKANLDEDRARERKAELLNTYERMISYATEHRVDAVLIAGDLFDTARISQAAKNIVWNSIRNHPKLLFFYLKGNHDQNNFFSGSPEIPENLKLFDAEWTTYDLGGLTISGREMTRGQGAVSIQGLSLKPEDMNLVMLHGQLIDAYSASGADEIPLKQFINQGIDYLALGHLHSYREEKLDGRGVWCYPGCLEGRGFDECGPHGFVLLDVDVQKHTCERQWISVENRRIWEIPVDISGLLNSWEISKAMEEACRNTGCLSQDLVHVILTGEVDVECEKDPEYLNSRLKMKFYAAKLSDETRLAVDPEAFVLDKSLKGEYVRTILADEALSMEEKITVIRYGLQAIAGEVIGS